MANGPLPACCPAPSPIGVWAATGGRRRLERRHLSVPAGVGRLNLLDGPVQCPLFSPSLGVARRRPPWETMSYNSLSDGRGRGAGYGTRPAPRASVGLRTLFPRLSPDGMDLFAGSWGAGRGWRQRECMWQVRRAASAGWGWLRVLVFYPLRGFRRDMHGSEIGKKAFFLYDRRNFGGGREDGKMGNWDRNGGREPEVRTRVSVSLRDCSRIISTLRAGLPLAMGTGNTYS